jgi:hypothetical protein
MVFLSYNQSSNPGAPATLGTDRPKCLGDLPYISSNDDIPIAEW